MKRRMLSLLLAMVMVLGMLPTIAFAAPIESSGVYQIGTAEDLLWFAQEVNGGNTGISGVLTADIDMSAVANWPGIGTATNMFAGSFDGQGHTVTFTDADWGLFGYVMGTDGNLITIQNVTTVGSVNRSAISHEAGFTHFKNCINRATISAKSTKVGGILGTVSGRNYISQIYSDVRFTNCGNEASITGFSYVGGILGYNSGAQTRLTGCYNIGNIHASTNVGGMVGYFQGSTGSAIVDSCYNAGRITGSDWIGGIVGEMENGAEVHNSYNSGSAYYAIAGERFNQTAKIINCYYLGTASAKCSPDYNETTRYDETTNEIATRATAVSGAEMATAEFAALLGERFVQSCPTPVLSWQTAKAHTGAVCANCKLGSTEKEIYDVTFQQHVGYTLNGESKATQGQAYSFTITITEGYEPVAGFAVKVNGEVISPASDGKYTVLNVKGPLSVTVLNVKVIPGNHSITLPGEGYGYRITGEKFVKRDADYTFNLTFVDGFKAGDDFKVIAQEVLSQEELNKGTVPYKVDLTGKNGIYTIPCVQKDYQILVSGVVAVPTVAPVTVNFTVTEGWYEFHEPNDSGEVIIDKTLTVPYFDLSLYGLEKYYYNPYCYLDEDGNIRNIQQKGTPETAYNNITAMHAFIVATELFYLGYSQDQVGTGRSYREMITVTDFKGEQVTVSKFANAISWSQDAGSSFMDFWDHGTNLNYYINYAYPLAYPGWGSTSDQEVIKNGDVISVHLITGVGSGSNFGFFTANDTNNKYNPGTDVVNEITVDQGQKVKLTYFWTATSGNYNTNYKLQKNKQLYWIYVEEDGIPERVEPYALEDEDGNTYYEGGWRKEPLGKNTVLKTDSNGVVTIDTAGLEPGTYYIGGFGGFEEGGGTDNAGFVSAGSEAGASFFKIVVQEYNGKLGDVDGDRNYTFQVTAFIEKTGEGGEKIRQDLLFTFVLKCEYNLDLDLELTWRPNDSNVRKILCGPDKMESFSVKNYDLTERVFGYSVQLTGSLAEDAQIISAAYTTASGQKSGSLALDNGTLILDPAPGSDKEVYNLTFTVRTTERDVTYHYKLTYQETLDVQLEFHWMEKGVTPRTKTCDPGEETTLRIKNNQLSAGAIPYELKLTGADGESGRILSVAYTSEAGGSGNLEERGSLALSMPEGATSNTYHITVTAMVSGQRITFVIDLYYSADLSLQMEWTDDGDGKMALPMGNYVFRVSQNGLQVSGSVAVSADVSFAVNLPEELWLKTDSFRLSGSYGAESNEEHKFTDAEFSLGEWNSRQTTVLVSDMFVGAVYSYAEYDTAKLNKVPTLTAIYTLQSTGLQMEKKLAFESWNSGAFEVLSKGAEGNTIIYRLTHEGDDGYTYSQDYTVVFDRIPTLTSVTVLDQDGTDQAATYAFSGDVKEYTYKVLDTTTSVSIGAVGLEEDYTITVNGQTLTDRVSLPVSGVTDITVVVSAGGYSNTYTLTIQPGEGKTLSFLSDKDVTIEVVNSNGVVMPFTTHRETNTQNRYKYTLVPGETYSYIATKNSYYHIADDFRLEDVANSTITVDFADMGDWLTELALGTDSGNRYKGNLPLNEIFTPENHSYQVAFADTEHIAYLWVTGSEATAEIQAIYTQIFSDAIYHGETYTIDMVSGKKTGEKLNRFLMDENPIENTLTIRLTKEENGVTYYQDYLVEFKRELTLKDISAKCDGVTTTLVRQNGTPGFQSGIRTYDITVSMAAQTLDLSFIRYTDNTCFGEESVGYEILVDGVDVTESGFGSIALDGTMNTQVVTVTVKNGKAPDGTGVYTLNILKSPPVEATFSITPDNALLNIYEVMSGERLWPDANGAYQLCEGYSYVYTATEYGYVGKSGTLEVTRNDQNELVVKDGNVSYQVTESGAGGAVTISWELPKAPVNSSINPGIWSPWPNFRGSNTNNAVTDYRVPTAAEDGTLYWANKLGSGYDADAVGSPIMVGGDLITYAGDNIFRIDTVTGEILATGKMDHKSSFSITPPTYAEGMVFVALSNGCVQAFNASTLESLWVYNDPLGGQPNCPLTVKDGYLYTGFWNSETGDANFVCMTITDEDPTQSKESKCVSWYHTAKGGYYWAGAYVGNGYVLIGTDDGTNLCNSKTSSLLLLDAKSGRLLDRRDNLNGDIRSTIVYDAATNAYYFTAKGGTFYSVQVSGGQTLTNLWSVALLNGTGGIPMSTSSPVVYNGRAYVGVSGSSQFGAYSGHNITVLNLNSRSIAYSVPTQGYPQTSGLLTTAYESESGYVYVYFFDNMTPGKLRVLRDRPGMTAPDYTTSEKYGTVAYALFTPTNDQAQYAICSPIVDEYGTVYFKNDSAHLMAFGSAIVKIEITTAPDKLGYVAGEKFDPTGMVVTATYANGKTRDITRYVSWSEEALTDQDTTFTISFEHVMYHNQEEGTEMISGVVSKTPTVTLELTIMDGTLGDVNHDGTIDLADAQMILDYEAKLLNRELSILVADVSGDGVIDSNDAVLIQQYLAGKFDKFPAEKRE